VKIHCEEYILNKTRLWRIW